MLQVRDCFYCQLLFYGQEIFSLLPFPSSSWLLTCYHLLWPQRKVCHFCNSHSCYFCVSRAVSAEISCCLSQLCSPGWAHPTPASSLHTSCAPVPSCPLCPSAELPLIMRGSKPGLPTQNYVPEVLSKEERNSVPVHCIKQFEIF